MYRFKCPVLVGCGTDGASVNVSEQNGMRGKLQAALPWLYWAWCYGHRLELACKDAFSSRLFHDIDEMLLRLYYLYEKSPRKCRELSDLVNDLKEVFEFPEGGNVPLRAHGSRWITYKRKALQRRVYRSSPIVCVGLSNLIDSPRHIYKEDINRRRNQLV